MKAVSNMFFAIVAMISSGAFSDIATCDKAGGCALDSAGMLQTVQKVARHNVSALKLATSREEPAEPANKKCMPVKESFGYCKGNTSNECHKEEPKYTKEDGCEDLKQSGGELVEGIEGTDDEDTYPCTYTKQRKFQPCNAPVDIWWLFDESGSVTSTAWNQVSDFLDNVMKKLKSSVDGIPVVHPDSRIASYTVAEKTLELTPLQKLSEATIVQSLKDNKGRQKGWVEVLKNGFETVEADIKKMGADWKKHRSFVFMVTDGHHVQGEVDNPIEVCKRMTAMGVKIVLVGVGSINSKINQWDSTGTAISTDFDRLNDNIDQVTATTCYGACSKDTKKPCGRSAGWGNSFWKMLNGDKDTGFAWRGEHLCYCPQGKDGQCTYHCKYDEQCVQKQDTAPHYDFGVCVIPVSGKEKCEREGQTVWEVILGASSCFERGTSTMASASPVGPWVITPMEEVRVADYVAAVEKGQLVADRVWANLHLADNSVQNMLEIKHELGVLSLTPDHMLIVDGSLQTARTVQPGQSLRAAESMTQEFVDSKILQVSHKIGRIVNPVTHSGYIVATNDKGVVISASTITESVDNVMLDAVRLRSLGKVASVLFPAELQASKTVEISILFGVAICKTMPAIFSLVFCFLADNTVGLIFILAHSSAAKAFVAFVVASRILKALSGSRLARK